MFNFEILADCQDSNVLAKQMVDKLFNDSVPIAQIIENNSLEHHAYTHPDHNKIEIKNFLNDNECKVNLVHEYTHRLRYKYQINDTPWFSEGLAQLAEMHYTSWPKFYSTIFSLNPYFMLSNVKDKYTNDSRSYPESFFLLNYIYSHFGNQQLLIKMMRSSKTGWDNILSSIRQLQQEQKINLGDKVITREFIIKHFAIALAINDSYLADYRLFEINPFFIPIIKQSISRIDVNKTYITDAKFSDFSILFSKHKIERTESFDIVYTIESLEPFILKSNITDDKDSEIYIYIKL